MYRLLYNLCCNRIVADNRLSILIYHRVLREKDALRSDIVSADEFDQHLSWVAKHFNVLPLDMAVSRLQSNTLPKRALAITFDDGYKDNLTEALPLLQKHSLHATFFISCDYLYNTPKWDYFIEAVRFTGKRHIVFAGEEFSLLSESEKADFCQRVPVIIKTHSEREGDRQLNQLIDQLGRVELSTLMMNEDDVRTLDRAGFGVGAHGDKHYIFANVPLTDAEREIVEGKQKLENILGKPVSGLAYPNGYYPDDFGDAHIALAKAAGYSYALATNIGSANSRSNIFALPRYTPWRRNKTGFLAEMAVNYFRG